MTVVNAQSKSLLAKLLATENITIQRDASAKTASFDVKNRVLTMPVWMGVSEDLEDMLTVHETGHALDTPSEEWLSAIEKITEKFYGDKKHKASEQVHGFLNVVEDARIDKRQKRRYPGSRRNYIVGYKELIERDFFGTANKDVNTFNFIDRLNMYFKGGIAHGVKFSSEENVFVHRCENTETFEEVVALTEEIFKYCKDRGEETKQQTQKEVEITYDKSKGAGEGDEYELDDDLDDDFDDMDEDDENEEEQGGEQAKDEDGENQKSSNNAGAVDTEDFVPEAKTEKAWREKQKDLVGNSNIEYVYVTLPKPNMKNIVSGYKSFLKDHKNLASKSAFHLEADWHTTARNNLKTFRNDENATISFMVKEFEMKKSADIFNRIAIAKTGVLDTNKLYSYKYNEDIFRRQSILPNGKNHGFVMFLDWSGSMTNNMRETVKQLISLTSFCKRVQIPFEVYIFRNTNKAYGEDQQSTACFDYKPNNMMFGDFALRNVLSSQMKIDELNKAYEILWMLPSTGSKTDPMCSTPLNQAIVAAEYVVKDFQSRTKVQIVNTIFLTDGGSDHIDGVVGVQRQSFSLHNTKKRNFIIQDDVMKKDYYLSSSRDIFHHEVGREVTNNLLKVLKDRTGCNLIGFYLYDRSGASSVIRDFYGYEVDAEFENKTKKFWNENKFIPVTSHGYDDYYIINTYAMKQRVNNLSVDPSMSKAKIAKEFMRFSEKKSVNRILLQRFIDKISSNKKKIA